MVEYPYLAELRDVRKAYGRHPVLDWLDLSIGYRDLIWISGDSGSGKSTLLKILGMFDRDFQGEYRFTDTSVLTLPGYQIDELRQTQIGYVFQEGFFLPALSLANNVLLPVRIQSLDDRTAQRLLFESYSREERNAGVLQRCPGKVSGGQRARAAGIRAISHIPRLLLLDEPTANLDPPRKQGVVKLLHRLHRQYPVAIVAVAHDPVFASFPTHYSLEAGHLQEIREEWQAQGVRTSLHEPVRAGATAVVSQHDPGRGGHCPHPPAKGPDPSAYWCPGGDGGDEDDGDGGDEHLPAVAAVTPVAPPMTSRRSLFWGFRPRMSGRKLLAFGAREACSRVLFGGLILTAVGVGCALAILVASLSAGAEELLARAIRSGSRITRLGIKPKAAHRAQDVRFPEQAAVAGLAHVAQVVARRCSPVGIRVADASTTADERACALHLGDPEWEFFEFAAGGRFRDPEALEAVVTTDLLPRLFGGDLPPLAGLVGREIRLRLRQYAADGRVMIAEQEVPVVVTGIIVPSEPGTSLYLPVTTLLVFDKWRRERRGEFPLVPDRRGWALAREDLRHYAAFAWEDKLHIYVDAVEQVLPTYRELAAMGYSVETKIFEFTWVVEAYQLARDWLPAALWIIAGLAAGTVFVAVWTSGKLKELENALVRVLGMRRGDLTLVQIIASVLPTALGAAGGISLGLAVVSEAKAYLATAYPDAQYHLVFSPVPPVGVLLVGLVALAITTLAAALAARKAWSTDPAKLIHQ